jgi:hydroxymethylbilane synthase
MGALSIRLGTRGSLLARTQSGQVADALKRANPQLDVELVQITTSGDRLSQDSLADLGGKGLFTKELEQALLAGQIDLAVHSLKDVPVTMPLVDQTELVLGAIPQREDPRDALISHTARSLPDLPAKSRIGTSSLRRRCQILQLRPDLQILPLRGNVDTRLRKLEEGEYDAIVLAVAGLKRISRFEPAWMWPIDLATMLPAAGQGALALQCRKNDQRVLAAVKPLHDALVGAAVTAERAVVTRLGGDCHSPIAALAVIENQAIRLHAAVGRRDGQPPVLRASASANVAEMRNIADHVCDLLIRAGYNP